MIVYQIPEETERVAQAAFPKGNLYMRLYEELGSIYSDSSIRTRLKITGLCSWGRRCWLRSLQIAPS